MNEQQSHPPEQSQFDVRQLVLRWLISTLAIFAAVWVVPGIVFEGPGWQLGVVAVVFGLLSAILRARMLMLSLMALGLPGLIIFGLFINALLLVITSILAEPLGIRFVVDGFWAAFFGGLVISFASTVLNLLAGDRRVVIRVRRGQHGDQPGRTDDDELEDFFADLYRDDDDDWDDDDDVWDDDDWDNDDDVWDDDDKTNPQNRKR